MTDTSETKTPPPMAPDADNLSRELAAAKTELERFRLAVEAAPVAMLMIDAQGTIKLANGEAERLFGWTRTELLDSPIDRLVPQRFRDGHPGHRGAFFQAPRARAMGAGRDLFGLTRDQSEVPIEIGLTPIETDDGTLVLASIIDITRRKRAEIELRQLNESLHRQSREKASAVDRLRNVQEQLVQSEKLASLGALVAGVAHEINTPVGVGLTAASHLRDEARALVKAVDSGSLKKSQLLRLVDTCIQSAEMVLSNLGRATELIQGFKQVAVDQSSSDLRTIDLGEYLEEVIAQLRPKFRRTPHRIQVDCAPHLSITTVPGALSQIITNFVMNSLLHAFEEPHQGLMKIEVTDEGDRVAIRYSDDGKGIPPDVLPRVFELFFTTKRDSGGSGLGMHIVYNLVHQTLKGSIHVASEVGRGTEFTVRVPKELAPAGEQVEAP